MTKPNENDGEQGKNDGARTPIEGDSQPKPGADKEKDSAKKGLRAGVEDRDASDDVGDREVENPGARDKLYTHDSKPRWGAGQPTLQDQLKAQRKTEVAIKKRQK